MFHTAILFLLGDQEFLCDHLPLKNLRGRKYPRTPTTNAPMGPPRMNPRTVPPRTHNTIPRQPIMFALAT